MEQLNDQLPPAQPSWAELVLLKIAVIGLFVMAVLVTTNVISRWIGRALIPDDILLVQELMVVVNILPIGIVTVLREHISVDLFTERAGRQAKLGFAILGDLVGIGFAAFLIAAAWQGFSHAWQTQEYYNGVLDIPTWVGHAIFLFAIGFFLLRLALMVTSDCRALFEPRGTA